MDRLQQNVLEIADLTPVDRKTLDFLIQALAQADDGGFFIYLSPEIPERAFIALLLKSVNEKRKDFEEADLSLDLYKPPADDSIEGKEGAIMEACRSWIRASLMTKSEECVTGSNLFVLDLVGTTTDFVRAHLVLSNTYRNTMLGSHGPIVFLLSPSGDWDELRKITTILFSDLRTSLSGQYRFGEHYQK
ncbi:MAG: hypothetical protein HY817_03815 [Candidatus Abawacabacteria bacterium]|nr:hypothetical protein [Candidatus Abawacabacteria bacterium]